MSDSSYSSWADINENLMAAIASRTSLIDQIQCHAVCKNWSGLIQKFSGANYAFPWLLLFGWKPHPNATICRLFDPTDQKMYTIDQDLTKKIFTRQERRRIDMMRICGCKNGWVVFQASRSRLLYGSRSAMPLSIDFVIYHPFSGRFVRLPELLSRKENNQYGTTTSFSSSPTSSDCVFLALRGSHDSNGIKIIISSCLVADQTWNEMAVVESIWACTRGLVCLDGTFYCLFTFGNLRSFDVATREWRLLRTIVDSDERLSWNKKLPNQRAGLVESNGKLLCVYMEDDRKYAVARFDFSRMNWVEDSTGLENIAVLFGADHLSFCIPAVGKAREMANTVNVFDAQDYNHYSYRVGLDHVRVLENNYYYRRRRGDHEVPPRRLHVYSSLCDELEDPNPAQPIWIPPVFDYFRFA